MDKCKEIKKELVLLLLNLYYSFYKLMGQGAAFDVEVEEDYVDLCHIKIKQMKVVIFTHSEVKIQA